MLMCLFFVAGKPFLGILHTFTLLSEQHLDTFISNLAKAFDYACFNLLIATDYTILNFLVAFNYALGNLFICFYEFRPICNLLFLIL